MTGQLLYDYGKELHFSAQNHLVGSNVTLG